jgi:predicted ArsR family transcriptional regulator
MEHNPITDETAPVSRPRRSRDRVVAILGEHPHGLTIGELTRLLGLKPNAVRKHLVALAEGGSVTSARVSPTTVGRPPTRYRLVDAPPNALADRTLARLLLEAARDVDARTAEQVAFESTLVRFPGSTLDDTLAVLGFAPADVTTAGQRRAGERTIVLRACPFLELVGRPNGRVICAFHRGLVRRDVPEGSALQEFRVLPDGPRCRVVLGREDGGRTAAVA